MRVLDVLKIFLWHFFKKDFLLFCNLERSGRNWIIFQNWMSAFQKNLSHQSLRGASIPYRATRPPLFFSRKNASLMRCPTDNTKTTFEGRGFMRGARKRHKNSMPESITCRRTLRIRHPPWRMAVRGRNRICKISSAGRIKPTCRTRHVLC